MTKQIDIQELIPFMKDGYVFMEKMGDWKFSKTKPQIIGARCPDGVFCKCWDRGYDLEQAFNIAPAEDWTKSLICIDESQNNLCITDDTPHLESTVLFLDLLENKDD